MTVIPLLPCASIDDMLEFYSALGFERTYRQAKPNPYLAMRRPEVELHFFGMPGFDPQESYGSCIVRVPDVGALHRAFADGLRAAYGKVPLAGIPRMTRPRPRKNVGGLSGFSVVDPGGNWIRVFPEPPGPPAQASTPPAATGRLARTLENAVVQADSHGDLEQAAKILDGALARVTDASPAERVEALAYRAELALSLEDRGRAAEALGELAAIPLTDDDRERLAETLATAEELRRHGLT
ncbi:bleomycin resistance protein [Actinopolymorpha alba]|uniref:bleomycin resistance protein n=1 Tax=Actinopolymorpha alba TaxID=533267 RepID=UPI00035FEA91|nr:VOC family protein [Actinopolymorpha alba]